MKARRFARKRPAEGDATGQVAGAALVIGHPGSSAFQSISSTTRFDFFCQDANLLVTLSSNAFLQKLSAAGGGCIFPAQVWRHLGEHRINLAQVVIDAHALFEASFPFNARSNLALA